MDSAITTELVVAAVTVVAAAIVGYRGQKQMGAAMLAAGAAIASGLCISGTQLGQGLWGNTGGWIGLIVGVIVVGFLSYKAANKVVRGKSGQFAAGLWLGYCGLCIFGYLSGGWVGLLTITLPSIGIFWIGLYRISAYILPLRDKGSQRPQAFRSLMTFSMGTNYPYYAAEDGQREERVPGNPYSQFFAGPGIVLADCDQAVYITDGIRVKGLGMPGLTFTGMFDLPPKVIDLRPQLRAFDVKALTKDGIPIKVLTFVPFRIRRGGRVPEPGKPFPFDPRAIFEAVAREPVDRGIPDAENQKHEWNVDMVPIIATRIVQDTISKYDFDELCAADDPARDPRTDIARELVAEATGILTSYGIEVLGGGIANLVPENEQLLERRFENWQTKWEHQDLVEIAKGEAERVRRIEEERALAEAEVILILGKVVEASVAAGAASETALALRFIDSLGEIMSAGEDQWPVPPALRETFDRLRGKLETGRC